MASLFNPITIKGIRIKNRIAVSPMCQYSSFDGFSNDWHLVHLGSRAVGGAGLIISEATAVSPEGRISPEDLGIWKDEHITGLKRITEFIESQHAVAGIQLAHAGRKASVASPWKGGKPVSEDNEGWKTVAPSAIPFNDGSPVPAELTQQEIEELIAAFGKAARRAVRAGFKVIEIHAAHGYLLHQFLSPLSNRRNDEYGGSFENRIRLLLQVTEEINKEWPSDYPLFVRVSTTDWTEGGWNIEDSIKLSKELKKLQVDLIDCSSGGNVPHAKIPVGPCYQVGFAERIRKEAGILTAAVGFITQAEEAESIIETGQADIILLAREFLRDPYFPLHAARTLHYDIDWPVQYERARR
ncbi:NADPH dehydrogenase NamA [Rubrolithibacter danxiaensis]|uniref:NADPH dehydrogenase NamA n=1 Tax=Rubrolithibacter danxiaensis TaxID=3390805 RepID=UPI003BF7DE45